MKNDYKIINDVVTIYLKNRKFEIYETYVDIVDFNEKLLNYKYSWHLHWSIKTKSYYAKSTEYLGILNKKPKSKAVYLHRFILDIKDENLYGDHINHNTLDNRRSNLQIVDNIYNNINRKDINLNNTSGYRNVSFIHGFYRVQLQINGKNHIFEEKFIDSHKAGKFAEEMRLKYYSNIELIKGKI